MWAAIEVQQQSCALRLEQQLRSATRTRVGMHAAARSSPHTCTQHKQLSVCLGHDLFGFYWLSTATVAITDKS